MEFADMKYIHTYLEQLPTYYILFKQTLWFLGSIFSAYGKKIGIFSETKYSFLYVHRYLIEVIQKNCKKSHTNNFSL